MFTQIKNLLKNKKVFLSLLFFVFAFSFITNGIASAMGSFGVGAPNGTDLGQAITGQSTTGGGSGTGLWDSMVNSLTQIWKTLPLALVGTVVYIISMATYWLAYAAILVLNLILSSSFISYSYTNPANNPIIETGLAITQSFVNMMLVVVLVYIALATILRLAGYETKKVLIWFVIMALLVNFSPVICGVIVDASNISMNYFLSSDSSTSTSKSVSQGSGMGLNMIAQAKSSLDLGKLWDAVSGGEDARDPMVTRVALYVAIAIMLIMVTIIYLMYAAVFLMRYFAIWILVILSPIAFVSYVLPKTKSMIWDKWWAQFIQWSIIGITCGFFLYLAGQFGTEFIGKKNTNSSVGQPTTSIMSLGQIEEGDGAYNTALEQTKERALLAQSFPANTNASAAAAREARLAGEGMANGIVQLFVPAMFLAIGLFFGFQTSAMGANAVLSFTKRKTTGLAMAPARIAGAGLGRAGSAASSGIGRRVNAALTTAGFSTRDIAGGVTGFMENKKVLRWFVPESVRKHGQYRPAVEAAKGELTPYSSSDLARRVAMGDLIGERATGALTEIIGRGDSEDIFKAYAKKYGYSGEDADQKVLADPRFKKDLSTPLKVASNSGMLGSTLLRKDPRLARVLADQKWYPKYKSDPTKTGGDKVEALRKAEGDAVKAMIADVKPGNIESWEKEVLDDNMVVENLMGREKNIWGSITKVKQGQRTAQQTVDKVYTKWMANEKNIKTREQFNAVADKGALWKQFDAHMTEKNGGQRGFFSYLESPKAREDGWRQGSWHTEGEKKITPVAGAVNLPATQPQSTAMPPAPPSIVDATPPQKAKRDTGIATRRNRTVPDVGAPNPSESKKRENPINKKTPGV